VRRARSRPSSAYLLFTGSRVVLVRAEPVLDAAGSPASGEEGFAPAGSVFASALAEPIDRANPPAKSRLPLRSWPQQGRIAVDVVERINALDDRNALLVLNRAVSGVAAVDRSMARFDDLADVWTKTAAQGGVTTHGD